MPDAPVSNFTVTLPRGPHSAFTGYGNLCAATKTVVRKVKAKKRVGRRTIKVTRTLTSTVSEKLVLPTTFTGQNGDVYRGNTPLAVTGCKSVASYRKAKKGPAGRRHPKRPGRSARAR